MDEKQPKTGQELFGIRVSEDSSNKIIFSHKGKNIGWITVEDKTISFEGNLHKTAEILFEMFKRYAEKYLRNEKDEAR